MIQANIPANLKLKVSVEQFEQLAIANRDLRLERKDDGELIVMPPTGGETGRYNSSVVAKLWNWNDSYGNGFVFDSSTGFRLSSSAIRSPDASWVSNSTWNSLTVKQKKKFPPICPEFVIELRSPSDRIEELREKMQEYINNGTKLGWLIDPETQKVEIYRTGQTVELLENPKALSGEDILPGFSLNLSKIW